VRREKQGFMFPIAYWFKNELHPFLRETLLNSHFVTQGLFQKNYIVQLLDEHKNSQVDHHVRLWMLLNLEIWHKIFIEHKNFTSTQDFQYP
jgi:asparagine synthase (glutamine-hydrolysing)